MYRGNKYGEKVDVNKYECGSCKYYLNQMKQVVEIVSLQQPVVSIKGFLITVMNWRHYANLEMKCYRRMKKADSW